MVKRWIRVRQKTRWSTSPLPFYTWSCLDHGMGLYRVSGGSITWGSPIALNSWMVCFMDNPTIRHFSMDEQCPKWIEMDRCLLVNCWDGYNMIYIYIYIYYSYIYIYIYYDPNMGTHVYKWLIMYCVKPLSLYRSPCWIPPNLSVAERSLEVWTLQTVPLDVGFHWIIKQTSPMEGFRSQKPRNSGYIWVYLGISGYTHGGPNGLPHNCHHFGLWDAPHGKKKHCSWKNGVPTNWLIHNNLPHLRKDWAFPNIFKYQTHVAMGQSPMDPLVFTSK